MQVVAGTHELDVSFYKVYKWAEDTETIREVTGENDALIMRKYDSVIEHNNHDLAIIIACKITGTALEQNMPIRISTHCTDTTTTNRALSNIIAYKFDTFTPSSNDAATIYTSAVSHFETVTAHQFIVNSAKTLDILVNVTDYSNKLVNGALDLYIQLDYSQELIDEFTFSLDDTTTTTFTNDLTNISCSLGE